MDFVPENGFMKLRYKLDNEWQKGYILKEMGGLWRTSKSRVLQKILVAKNVEERMQLKPDNIKSIHEWKDFIKGKTSDEFKKDMVITQVLKDQDEMKKELAQYRKFFEEMQKKESQNQTSQECDDELNAPVHVSVNMKTNITKCKLLDWEGSEVVVAEGCWFSSDPKALAHHIPIRPKAMRIWVDVAKEHEKYLWRTTPYMT